MAVPDVVVGNPVLEILFVGVMLLSAVIVYITFRSTGTENSLPQTDPEDEPEEATQ